MVLAVVAVVAGAVAVGGAGIWFAVTAGGESATPAVAVDRTPSTVAGGPEGTTPTTESGPGSTVVPGADASSWVDLLERVPNLPANRGAPIEILDYARVRAQLDVELPPADADAAELGAYIAQTLQGPFASGDPAAVRDELGFDVGDFDQVVSLGLGPRDLVVLRGRFDAQGIADAVRTDPVWRSMLEERQYSGTLVYSWGEDNGTSDQASQARPAGESRRLALLDDTVVWARSDDAVVATLEAIDGGNSLGRDPGIRELAATADELGVLAAQLFPDADTYRRLRPALLPGETPIPAGVAVLTGTALSNVGLVQVNAVLYESEAEAEAAAAIWQAAVGADPEWAPLILVQLRGAVLVNMVAVGQGAPDTVPPTGYQPAFE